MANVFYEGKQPLRTVYVTVGSGTGDGSAGNPYHSIQQAVSAAKPGTLISVSAGTYFENVKIPHNRSGSDAAPIWLVSADGSGAAKIVAPNSEKPVIRALGVDNYVIKGFSLKGGYDGIQFSQSGRDFSNMVSNVAIIGNTIDKVAHDGIKVGQADNVFVLGNRISNVASEEGIDFVAVTNGVIRGNDISNVHGTSAAVFAKGGSTHISITDNRIHDVDGDGIAAGGRTDASSFKPGSTLYEALDVTVVGNRVESVGKHPISVRGAHDVEIRGNYLEASDRYHDAVYVTSGNPAAKTLAMSSDVIATHNAVINETKFFTIDKGNGTNVRQSGNTLDALPSKPVVTTPVKVDPVGTGTTPEKVAAAPAAGQAFFSDAGPDAFAGGRGSDTVFYGASHAGVRASLAQPQTNTGEAKGDAYTSIENLAGSRFADVLVGDKGANVLNGGLGSDILDGGAGTDSFVFNTALGPSNIDTIRSFSAKDDTVRLDKDVFGAFGAAGTPAAGAFHMNDSGRAHDADDHIIYNSATGDLFYDVDGSGGAGRVRFAHLDPGLSLTPADFLIVA